MVNRSIQAKMLKMKRRGKSPRRGLQIVNTGSGPTVDAMNMYYHKLIDTEFDKQLDKYLDGKFPRRRYQAPSDKVLQDRNSLLNARISLEQLAEEPDVEKIHELETSIVPLTEVKSLLARMQEVMKSTMMDNFFKAKNRPGFWTQDIFFSSDKSCWCIIEMKDMPGERFIRKSQTYPSKTIALQVLESPTRIRWVETVPLPDSSPNTSQ